MRSLQVGHYGPLCTLLLLAGIHIDALAASSLGDCDRTDDVSDPSALLVDYQATSKPADLLDDPSLINSSPVLTSKIDTSIRRGDTEKAGEKLPASDKEFVPESDAASLLLERRRFSDNLAREERAEAGKMSTRLPGMDSDEMLQFRQQMYRTDI